MKKIEEALRSALKFTATTTQPQPSTTARDQVRRARRGLSQLWLLNISPHSAVYRNGGLFIGQSSPTQSLIQKSDQKHCTSELLGLASRAHPLVFCWQTHKKLNRPVSAIPTDAIRCHIHAIAESQGKNPRLITMHDASATEFSYQIGCQAV